MNSQILNASVLIWKLLGSVFPNFAIEQHSSRAGELKTILTHAQYENVRNVSPRQKRLVESTSIHHRCVDECSMLNTG